MNELLTPSKEDLQVLKGLRLLDDDFMTVVFEQNIEATELLLKIILRKEGIKVLRVETQAEQKNPIVGGRSITLDIYAEDSDGLAFDVEVQRDDAGADPHRARYHSSVLDSRMLKTKQSFKELRDSYVIFITENDVLGKGLPMYHINRRIEEISENFNDGSHIIYVNGAYKNDEDPVGRLMHDFRCTSAVDMFYDELAKSVRFFKETEGGQSRMSKAMEDRIRRAEEETRIETTVHLIKEIMGSMKMTAEQVMTMMNISDEDRTIMMKKIH